VPVTDAEALTAAVKCDRLMQGPDATPWFTWRHEVALRCGYESRKGFTLYRFDLAKLEAATSEDDYLNALRPKRVCDECERTFDGGGLLCAGCEDDAHCAANEAREFEA
jgi:hypothetical protein